MALLVFCRQNARQEDSVQKMKERRGGERYLPEGYRGNMERVEGKCQVKGRSCLYGALVRLDESGVLVYILDDRAFFFLLFSLNIMMSTSTSRKSRSASPSRHR